MRRGPPAASSAIRTEPVAQRLQPPTAVPEVGFEMVALGPLVPGLHPQQTLLLGAVANRVHRRDDVAPGLLGSGCHQRETTATGPGRVVPVRVHAGMDAGTDEGLGG